MNTNIYIKTLEIGQDNMKEGISFNELIIKLCIQKTEGTFYTNFRIWFYDNFYNELTISNRIRKYSPSRAPNYPSALDDEKCYISAKSTMEYLDYIELKEARESAKFAKKIAIISIGLTLTAIIVQIIISS